jgi:hypothetical protein
VWPPTTSNTSDLLGGEHDRAHGRTDAASDPHLVTIDEEECHGLLAGGGVGRVVFRSAGRPVALPVNFKMLAQDVIFRSADDGEVSAIAFDEQVSFEVDRIDDAMGGWRATNLLLPQRHQAHRQRDQYRSVRTSPRWGNPHRPRRTDLSNQASVWNRQPLATCWPTRR